jgi:hypothetical protein
MKLALFLLLLASSAQAQITNLSFGWFPSPNATGYRFYSYNGTNRIFLATMATNRFTVTNWDLSQPRTVGVTATNMIMETSESKLDVPPAPVAPQNLLPIPLSINTPVPGVLEISRDLVDWTERLKLTKGSSSSNVNLTWVQYPAEPVTFMRTKAAAIPASPPSLPIR